MISADVRCVNARSSRHPTLLCENSFERKMEKKKLLFIGSPPFGIDKLNFSRHSNRAHATKWIIKLPITRQQSTQRLENWMLHFNYLSLNVLLSSSLETNCRCNGLSFVLSLSSLFEWISTVGQLVNDTWISRGWIPRNNLFVCKLIGIS